MDDGSRVHVGNLPPNCKREDLEPLFEQCGKIRYIDLKGFFGFITFEDPASGQEAVDKLNNTDLNGSQITVARARSRGGDERGPSRCFICGSTGHRAAECPDGRRGDRDSCYICGERGHISRYCPNRRDDRGGRDGGRRGRFDERYDRGHYSPYHSRRSRSPRGRYSRSPRRHHSRSPRRESPYSRRRDYSPRPAPRRERDRSPPRREGGDYERSRDSERRTRRQTPEVSRSPEPRKQDWDAKPNDW
ncbi:putative serine/arginine-rich splicing factor RS2Z33 [Blattamonas nauphoetae]|uniref:Serine/arginine-rich splicing factor RS2Z33 n=1 Tax=Blattamonas nauphoetae TaxID=2049346 RepID=A0ABQ9XE86_9EUKA|nr:putative serine/arginine-rich splicing factor RS2Z33 [Blattamonas nauphoetae]